MVLTLAAAGIGVVAVRVSVRAGMVGVALFGLVGALASLGRGGGGVAAPLPSMAGALTAAGVLVLLCRLAPRVEPDRARELVASDRVASPAVAMAASRRRFLGAAAGVGVASVAVGSFGRWLQQQAATTAARLRIVLPRPKRPLPPVPADVSVDVEGVSPFLTPNERFYRIDTALIVPRVDVEDWTLRVTGEVEADLTLTYAELLDRELVEADVTIACVSNEVGGDLVGTARWLGCRLDDLLEEAGVRPSADQVVGRSVDGFTAGFPTALLDGRDALVAVGMNGEPLPVDHGFPARLIVPGVYGYVSATKWLSEIELTRFDRFQGYWIPRGWAVEAPVKTQSRIDTPRPGARLIAGEPVAVAGVAWAPIRGIERVEVRVDDGPWEDAELGAAHAGTTWRQWTHRWTPTAGRHRLQVRATDGDGSTQTGELSPVAPDGATGWHSVTVRAA